MIMVELKKVVELVVVVGVLHALVVCFQLRGRVEFVAFNQVGVDPNSARTWCSVVAPT